MQVGTTPAALYFIMQFIYIVCKSQQDTFCQDILFPAAKKSSEVHICLYFAKSTFSLNTAIHPKQFAFFRCDPSLGFFFFAEKFLRLQSFCFFPLMVSYCYYLLCISFSMASLYNLHRYRRFFTDITSLAFDPSRTNFYDLFLVTANVAIIFFIV